MAYDVLMALIQGGTAVPKSFAKLIDTAGEQIGLFLNPVHTRRNGVADANADIIREKSKAEIAVIKLESKLAIRDIQDRATERVLNREAKRQEHMEAILGKAAGAIPETVSNEPVDPDWTAQFFDHCQDVSDDQMQTVWGRILAGEVAKPRSFSLKTLSLVRVMSKQDAELFTRFCSTVWMLPNGATPIILALDNRSAFPLARLEFSNLTRLESMGLISLNVSVSHFAVSFPVSAKLLVSYFGRRYFLQKVGASMANLGVAILTDSGKELATIAGAPPNEEYRKSVIEHFRREGWTMQEIPAVPFSVSY